MANLKAGHVLSASFSLCLTYIVPHLSTYQLKLLKLVSTLRVLLGLSETAGTFIFQWDSAQSSKLVFSLSFFSHSFSAKKINK